MKKLFFVLSTLLLSSLSFQVSNAHTLAYCDEIIDMELPGGAYLIFAGKFGGDLTIKDIAATQTLGVDGCAKGSAIYKYDLKITKNGKTTTFHGTSDQLTSEMHKQLKELSVGDEFTFKNIKARLPKEGTVEVWAKKFTVV